LFNKKGQVAITLIFIILGVMISLQFRTQKSEGIVSIQRAHELTADLKQAREKIRQLESENDELMDRLKEVETSASQVSAVVQGLRRDLDRARLVAGLVDVEGSGVIVVLDDSARKAQPGEDPNVFLIHDDDILKVVNELTAAGAEAISVNDQRIIALSEIRCAGPAININGIRTAPPYEIRAIGNPHTLETSLKLRGGVIEALEFWGIQVSVKRQDRITIPKFSGNLTFDYTTVVGGDRR
jgi:uncharacterized protein YlxW (UPF0749 family)